MDSPFDQRSRRGAGPPRRGQGGDLAAAMWTSRSAEDRRQMSHEMSDSRRGPPMSFGGRMGSRGRGGSDQFDRMRHNNRGGGRSYEIQPESEFNINRMRRQSRDGIGDGGPEFWASRSAQLERRWAHSRGGGGGSLRGDFDGRDRFGGRPRDFEDVYDDEDYFFDDLDDDFDDVDEMYEEEDDDEYGVQDLDREDFRLGSPMPGGSRSRRMARGGGRYEGGISRFDLGGRDEFQDQGYHQDRYQDRVDGKERGSFEDRMVGDERRRMPYSSSEFEAHPPRRQGMGRDGISPMGRGTGQGMVQGMSGPPGAGFGRPLGAFD